MTGIVTFSTVGEVGIISINSPPVNALGHAVRLAIVAGINQALSDDAVKAIILSCEGRTFFAGADISEFGRPFAEPDLVQTLKVIGDSTKPVIAAMHGTVLGGGLETALHCHYRLAVASAKFGLPEVHLGLLPGAGGTQLLPRLVGALAALEIMTSGKPIDAKKALHLGILDKMLDEGDLRDGAIAFAREVIAVAAPLPLLWERDDMIALDRAKPDIFGDYLKQNARAFKGFLAPTRIVEAVRASVDLPFAEGLAREQQLFAELMESTESKAQRYVFFAERLTSKIPDLPTTAQPRELASVGVIGAGTMGGGIAMNFLNIGMPVVLVEQSQEALDRGLATIRANYQHSVKSGRLTANDVESRLGLITPVTDIAALRTTDLIIEAVFESMAVKQTVFSKIDQIAKPGAILASNTSFLSIDDIAACTSRPKDVIGLHFFSPANIMPLLEVVRGRETGADLIATTMALAKRIGKTPVLSRVCHGFIANRVMQQRSVQADSLSLHGMAPADIDRVMVNYGFAMGPFEMIDLVGLDVMGRDSDEKTVMSELVARGRLGQKQNGGFYDYNEKRQPTASPIAAQIIRDIASERGISQVHLDDEEMLARLLYPVVNEGAKLLEEGIAIRSSDIDIALIKGYNWPVYRGGPMFWAETVGLKKITLKLEQYAKEYGASFEPSSLLKSLAAEGRGFGSI